MGGVGRRLCLRLPLASFPGNGGRRPLPSLPLPWPRRADNKGARGVAARQRGERTWRDAGAGGGSWEQTNKKKQLGGWELHGDAPRGHPPTPTPPPKKKCLCLPCCPKLRKSGWASLPPGPDDDARSHRASSPVSGERGRTWAATPVKATGGASSQGPASSEERLRAGKHPSFACPVSIPAQMCILLRPHLLPLQTGMLASPSHLTTASPVDTPGKMLRRRPLQPSQDVELGGGGGGDG